jgi:hypothetical protein
VQALGEENQGVVGLIQQVGHHPDGIDGIFGQRHEVAPKVRDNLVMDSRDIDLKLPDLDLSPRQSI